MNNSQPAQLSFVVLAAGLGSRYGGLKQMEEIGPNGETLMDYNIYTAIQLGFGRLVFLTRNHLVDALRSQIGEKWRDRAEIVYVPQEIDQLPSGFQVPPDREKPWGTGHAILSLEGAVAEPFAVTNADDWYGPHALAQIHGFLQQADGGDPSKGGMVGYRLHNTLSEHGGVSRGICQRDESGYLQSIVEVGGIQKKTNGSYSGDVDGREQRFTGEEFVSMNLWGFTPGIFDRLKGLFEAFLRENLLEPKAEFYISTAIGELMQAGAIGIEVLPTDDQWFGMTYQPDHESAVRCIRELIEQGVYPDRL